jgi:hypothetical protein
MPRCRDATAVKAGAISVILIAKHAPVSDARAVNAAKATVLIVNASQYTFISAVHSVNRP